MKQHRLDPKTKAMIVLEGLRGRPIAELCTEHQISQTQYYRWRDRFLTHMHQAFENGNRKEAVLTCENARLKKIIGELTVELKKSEGEWW